MKNFYILIISIIALTSCYTEDRVKPSQTKLNAVTVTSYVYSNNNNSNNTATLYLSDVNYSFSQQVDSNGNNKYSSFVTNVSTVFNKAGKFKYSLYVKTNYSSIYYPLGSSGIITIPNNLSFNFSKKFFGDSLVSFLGSTSTSDYLYFYIVLQDSSGNYIQQSYNNYNNNLINYVNIGSNKTETINADTTVSLSNFSLYPVGKIDKNLNGYPQTFNGVTVYFSNSSSSYVQGSKYYLKLYFKPLNTSEKILYGVTAPLTTSGSNYYGSSFTPLVDTLSKGNYTFYVSIFDKSTNKEIIQPDPYDFTQDMESKNSDTRQYTFNYLGKTIKDDVDADGFPASYLLKTMIKASDSAKVNLIGTLYYADYGSNYYRTLITSIPIVSGDTATFLVTGGALLSHSYYDLRLVVRELDSYNSIGYWDKITIPDFNGIPFETFDQD